MNYNDFLKRFAFNAEKAFCVGVERECFLTNTAGDIVPVAPDVVGYLDNQTRFGYELSACQLEERVGPCTADSLCCLLDENNSILLQAEAELNFRRSYIPVAPEHMPLDVYPDPTGRYQEIVKTLPEDTLRAACRVAAVHVHVGMPDHHTALRVYNRVVGLFPELCALNSGDGERIKIYADMAPDYIPPAYADWREFYAEAVERGFAEDPRKCWHMIRLSVHGTIEFRMFDTIHNNTCVWWIAKNCLNICSRH